jgi:hypothetical protein
MVIEVLGGKMDLHMGSHSLPLKFMPWPCMHSQCPRLFTSSKGPICLLLPFWILPACYWGHNGRSFATFPFPSRFDQGINAILVLGLQFYVGIGFANRDLQLTVQIASTFMEHVRSIFICISIGFLFFSFLSPLLPNLQRL